MSQSEITSHDQVATSNITVSKFPASASVISRDNFDFSGELPIHAVVMHLTNEVK